MLQFPDGHVFKNPFATSIYPILNPEQTYSLLHDINASRPAKTRLPLEISLYINKEVHAGRNTLLEKIRDSWTPVSKQGCSFSFQGYSFYPSSLERLRLNIKEKRYYVQKVPASKDDEKDGDVKDVGKEDEKDVESGENINNKDGGYNDENCESDDENDYITFSTPVETRPPPPSDISIKQTYCPISSADLLYRLRCCFPELNIDLRADGYQSVWDVYLKHNQCGIIVLIQDHLGFVIYETAGYVEDSPCRTANDEITKQTLSDTFASGMQLLLSVLHETIDGSRRLVYYHPAANADCFSDDEQGYIAVPYEVTRDREYDAPESAYRPWKLGDISIANTSSFRSILHELKYDIPNRKVDRANGTANLTTVISSALLFYRLLCKFVTGYMNDNVYTVLPITSIWQVQLIHISTGHSVIFMDDRGLFDIRVDAGIPEKAMEDVEALVEALCSDKCTHPYDGTVAGCVA